MFKTMRFELSAIRRLDDAMPGEPDVVVEFRTVDQAASVRVAIPLDRCRYREEHYVAVARHELALLLAGLADRSKGYRLTDMELALART